MSRIFILGLALFVQWTASAANPFLVDSCLGGGDGPTPMHDGTDGFPSYVQLLATDNNVSEFVVWENRNQLVYRDQTSQVVALSTEGQSYLSLPSSQYPLARVVDSAERYLLTSGADFYLDTLGNKVWTAYDAPPDDFTPLFWQGNVMYGTGTVGALIGGTQYRMYAYSPGDSGAGRICRFQYFPLKDGYTLAQGSAYPNIVYYTQEETSQGTSLTVVWANVASCTTTSKTYKPFKGKVTNIYWYESLKSTLIQIDRSNQQLMWDTGPDDAHCHTYGIGNSSIFVPGYDQPLLIAYDPTTAGFTLMYLDDPNNNPGMIAAILQNFQITSLSSGNLWLSHDAQTLYGTPQFTQSRRYILKIDLPAPPYPPQPQPTPVAKG